MTIAAARLFQKLMRIAADSLFRPVGGQKWRHANVCGCDNEAEACKGRINVARMRGGLRGCRKADGRAGSRRDVANSVNQSSRMRSTGWSA
ncbi:hypothetical protein BCEP4_1550009 [Burkholderia cepacia]|nr:hypothetical protein BCEP4_1550009 [Burkholderia cepacia]